jgi:ribosomal protein L30
LKKVNQSVTKELNDQIKGMINTISHLINVEEVA